MKKKVFVIAVSGILLLSVGASVVLMASDNGFRDNVSALGTDTGANSGWKPCYYLNVRYDGAPLRLSCSDCRKYHADGKQVAECRPK